MQYVSRLSGTFYNITSTYSQMMRYSANIAGVQQLEEDYKLQMSAQSEYPAIESWKIIELQNLHFTYKDQNKESHTIHDTHMNIHLGEKIALVGESGSGKSTFLTLLR
jgi:ABC-type transport system involved in cytochrome bd biosynthesis fused ATPase/permease subunit